MIELTEVTAMLLYESLEEAGLSKDCGLRLIREEGRLNLHLDLSMPDDWVIAYKDRLLMIICTASEIGSEPCVIDTLFDDNGPKLVLRKMSDGSLNQESIRGMKLANCNMIDMSNMNN